VCRLICACHWCPYSTIRIKDKFEHYNGPRNLSVITIKEYNNIVIIRPAIIIIIIIIIII